MENTFVAWLVNDKGRVWVAMSKMSKVKFGVEYLEIIFFFGKK